MSISLAKGGNISLTKSAPGLQNILVGLGWDVRATDGMAFDLDAVVFLVGADEKVRSGEDFIFYNNLVSGDGSVEHTGDNRTGIGEGDDEAVRINLAAVPPEIMKVVIGVTIHEAEERAQNFGMVRSASVRVVNEGDGMEITRYDLSEDASVETALILGEVYRHGADWKFRAVGQGFRGGLLALATHFGVQVG